LVADSVPKAGVCTGGAPNAPVRLQDCCKSSFHEIYFLFSSSNVDSLNLKKTLFYSLDL
jgi:hypothetical protein